MAFHGTNTIPGVVKVTGTEVSPAASAALPGDILFGPLPAAPLGGGSLSMELERRPGEWTRHV